MPCDHPGFGGGIFVGPHESKYSGGICRHQRGTDPRLGNGGKDRDPCAVSAATKYLSPTSASGYCGSHSLVWRPIRSREPSAGPFQESMNRYRATIPPATSHSTTPTKPASATTLCHEGCIRVEGHAGSKEPESAIAESRTTRAKRITASPPRRSRRPHSGRPPRAEASAARGRTRISCPVDPAAPPNARPAIPASRALLCGGA